MTNRKNPSLSASGYGVSIVVGVCVLILMAIIAPAYGNALSQQPIVQPPLPTLTETPTITPSSTPTNTPPTSTTSFLQQDLLSTYQSLAETSRDAVKTAESTMTKMLALAALLSAFILAGMAYAAKQADGARRQAQLTAQNVHDLDALKASLAFQVGGATNTVSNLETRIGSLELKAESLGALVGKMESSLGELTDAQRELLESQQMLESGTVADAAVLGRWLQVSAVEEYELALFSGNDARSSAAKKALLDLGSRQDPFLQLSCLEIFGRMPDYLANWHDQNVYELVRWLASNGSESLVRTRANEVVTQWDKRRSQGTPTK